MTRPLLNFKCNGRSAVDLLVNNDRPPARKSNKWLMRNNKSSLPCLIGIGSFLHDIILYSNAVAVQVSWPRMIYQGTQKFTRAWARMGPGVATPLMALLDSSWLYSIPPWIHVTLLDSTTLYHGSTWLYLSLLHTTMALLGCTWLYYTLPWIYLALPHSTMLLLDSTWLYYTLPWL